MDQKTKKSFSCSLLIFFFRMRLVPFIRRSAPYCLVISNILILGLNDLQVPGAELGEGGSVVDLSHIAPSVLALIQVAA